MLQLTITHKNSGSFTSQYFELLPRIGDKIRLLEPEIDDPFDSFDYSSDYRIIDVLIYAGDSSVTGIVPAELFVEKIG